MDAVRANEKLVELHGDSAETSGGVKDWQADRLARSLAQMEVVFDQALTLQKANGPVSADVAHQIQATMADLRAIAGRDEKSMNAIREHAEDFLYAAEDFKMSAFPKNPVAAVALLASQEFVKSDYFGISGEDCGKDPAIDRLCQRSRAIVEAGYIHERDLQGVKVAITDMESANATAAAKLHGLAEGASGKKLPAFSVQDASQFQGDAIAPRIDVHEDESAKFHGSSRAEPVVDMFSHELGHWLARDKSAFMLQAGVEQITARGGPEAATVEKLLPRDSLEPDNLMKETRGIVGQELRVDAEGSTKWLSMVKEMQADIMSIAAEKAEHGNAAAMTLAAGLIKARDQERLEDLADTTAAVQQGPAAAREARFAEEHHTTIAVREFAARIEAGDLDKVRTPAQFDKLMGETIASSLVKEYTQVRTAELNVHHIENGRVVPGLPPGVDMKDVLAAEMGSNLRHPAGTPTVLVTAEEAKRLAPDAQVAPLNVPSKLPGAESTTFHLATKAPDGLPMPELKQGTVNIEGHVIDNRMAGFAKDVVSQGKEFLQELSQSKVLSAPGAAQRAAELGSQEQQGQQKAQEKAGAESAPKAVEMAM